MTFHSFVVMYSLGWEGHSGWGRVDRAKQSFLVRSHSLNNPFSLVFSSPLNLVSVGSKQQNHSCPRGSQFSPPALCTHLPLPWNQRIQVWAIQLPISSSRLEEVFQACYVWNISFSSIWLFHTFLPSRHEDTDAWTVHLGKPMQLSKEGVD